MQDKASDLSPYKAAQGTLYLLVTTIVISFSSSIFFILIARFFPTVSDFGLVNGLQILINMAVILASLGLTNATIRFMSYYFGAEKQDTAKEVGILTFRIGLLSSMVISAVFYISAPHIASLLFHQIDYIHLIHLASIDIFVLSLTGFLVSILYSLQEFKKIAATLIFAALIKSSVGLVLLISGMNVSGIVIGYIIGDASCLLIFVYILRNRILKKRQPPHQRIMTTLFKYSFPLLGSSILTFFSTNVDYYLVLIFTSLTIAGIYSPAILIGSVLLMILASLEQTLLPYFSRLYGKTDIHSLKNISTIVSRYLFLIYLPVGFAIFASSPLIITGIFGERYIESIYPTMTIILVLTLTSIGTIFNTLLKSAGHTKIFLTSTLCAVLVQVLVSIFTISSIGATGAALARSSAYSVMLILPAYKLKQVVGLPYDNIALQKGLIGSCIVTFTIFALNWILVQPYYLLVSLPVAFISYLLFLRFAHAMNAKDFEIIDEILLGKLKCPLNLITKIVLH
jgi:O-antigen/teichoic acid export membrane protein